MGRHEGPGAGTWGAAGWGQRGGEGEHSGPGEGGVRQHHEHGDGGSGEGAGSKQGAGRRGQALLPYGHCGHRLAEKVWEHFQPLVERRGESPVFSSSVL